MKPIPGSSEHEDFLFLTVDTNCKERQKKGEKEVYFSLENADNYDWFVWSIITGAVCAI